MQLAQPSPSSAPLEDDLSIGLGRRVKEIRGADGKTLAEFVAALRPRYGRAQCLLAAGWLALTFSLAPAFLADQSGDWLSRAGGAILSSLLVGYAIAYIALFLHEGAHFGLAADKRRSDLITNLAVGILVCQDVRRYRLVHWQHHLKLGQIDDTERSYFNALSPGFIFRTLTGLQVLAVLATRRGVQAEVESKPAAGVSGVMLAGILLHLGIVLGLAAASAYATAAAWIIGLGAWFPFFGALRQLLEHRADDANAGTDYLTQPHGAFTRLFAAGPIGSTLGGAGFRHHLLHHWLPQISCTNLAATEDYLLSTDLGVIIRQRRTTYMAAFQHLLRQARRQRA